jgi:hypothetical protein
MSDSVHEFHSVLLGNHWTSNTADADVDLRYYYASPLKREVKAQLVAKNAGSDTGTLAMKIQESATTVDSDFADITGAAFTTLTDASTAGIESIYFAISTGKKFLRSQPTVTGGVANGGWWGACILTMLKRMA